MDATPRFRLFDNRRGSSNQMDEEAGQATATLPRRRMLTSSVAVARQRRRNRRRPGDRRGLAALVPRLLASSVSRASRRRALLLLLVLAACGAGVLASARLLARASLSYSSWPSSSSLPGYLHSSGAGSTDRDDNDDDDDDDDDDDADRHKHRRPAVSLGPDAIPSVLLVERGPSGLPSGPALPGGARKASSLVDVTGAVLGDGGGGGEIRGGEGRENSSNPYRCRNTVQGATLVADSEGRVCHRAELIVEEGDDDDVRHRPGCCAPRPPALPLLPPRDGGGGGGGDLAVSSPPATDDKHKHPPAAPHSGPATTRTETRRGVEGGVSVELVELGELAHGGGGGGGGGGAGGFPPEEALSTPFSCWSCDVGEDGPSGNNGGGNDSSFFSSCCSSYEFCVSCCQNPQRGKEREAIQASAALSGHPAYRDLLGPGNNDASNRRELPPPRQLQASHAAAEAGVEKSQEEAEERDAREMAFAHCAFRCRTYSGSVVHENSYRSPLKHCFGRFRPPAASAAAAALPGGRAGVVEGRESRGAPPHQVDPLLFDLAEP
ncbi:unnamed protein product [Ectocarpus sp. CCAP 1310/34]|nr:unnamed protein product [Ectocarpus sp. CCAP 1310/34]